MNLTILHGNLCKDIELRYTQNQKAVTTLRIATNEKVKNANGEYVDETEYHDVVVWGKNAENCSKYLSKGSSVLIEGKTKSREWTDNNSVKRLNKEVIAHSVTFVGGNQGDNSNQGQYQPPPYDNNETGKGTAGCPF